MTCVAGVICKGRLGLVVWVLHEVGVVLETQVGLGELDL